MADTTISRDDPGLGELPAEDRERNLFIVGILLFICVGGIICGCFFICLNYYDRLSAFRVRRSARIQHQRGQQQETVAEERAAVTAKALRKMAARNSRHLKKTHSLGSQEKDFWTDSFLSSVSSWDDLENPAEPDPELSPKKKNRRNHKSKSRRQTGSAKSEEYPGETSNFSAQPKSFSHDTFPQQFGTFFQSHSNTNMNYPEGSDYQGASPHSTAPIPAESLEIVSDIMTQLGMELDRTQSMSLEWRRRHFKELLFKWHPDKNPHLCATAVFQKLMLRRGAYLDA